MDDAIVAVMEGWPAKWCRTLDLSTGSSRSTTKQKKEETRLNMEQLVKRRWKEAEEKSNAKHAEKKQEKEEDEERDFDRCQKSPSP